MAFIDLSHVSFTYPQCERPVLEDISFSVERGELIAVCGATGSGKSTLLRLLKRELTPQGNITGSIRIADEMQQNLDEKTAAYKIGYVMQRPEQQLVTDKVWHELAFGLENMHLPQRVIARRVAEIAAYFDMESWFDQDVAALSGGQKQLLNLASVMVMQPDVLILDEPTAQLDPIAAGDFIATIHKINRELGLTVLIAEHRLEEIIPICDRMLVLENGRIFACDVSARVIEKMKDSPLLCAMPAAARVYHALNGQGKCPLDVREGRNYITDHYQRRIRALESAPCAPVTKEALAISEVYYRYEKSAPDVLSGLNLTVRENEIFCLLGGNGSGKTTALNVAAGILKAYSGSVRVFGKRLREYRNQSLYHECLTMLPQDVQTVFLCNTVREELKEAQEGLALLPFDLTHLFDQHPYDLSGGEQQLVALAKVLSTKPRLLLLDEPTKGIDAAAKQKLLTVLRKLKEKGMTIAIVTHDVEFTALCADRCALFFRGNIISEGTPRAFFAENSFYTTAVSRMTRGYYDNAVTVEDAVQLCRANGRKDDDV